MSGLMQNKEIIILLGVMIIEAWLGKTKKTRASSTLELIFILIKKLILNKRSK